MHHYYRTRFSILFLSVIALVSLAACGSRRTETVSETASTVKEATYSLAIELASQENLLFSKYDVEVYLDDSLLGTIDHGTTNKFTAEVTKGKHRLMLTKEGDSSVDGQIEIEVAGETTLRYRFESTRKQIVLEEVSADDDEQTEVSDGTVASSVPASSSKAAEPVASSQTEVSQEALPEVLSQDHPDLAAILSTDNPELGRQFAEKYKGKLIEFDGHVAYINPHGDYKTRYDILINGGDWVSMEQTNYRGINMQFNNVATTSSPFSQMDGIGLGSNLRIKARVIAFGGGDLLQLEPIEVTNR